MWTASGHHSLLVSPACSSLMLFWQIVLIITTWLLSETVIMRCSHPAGLALCASVCWRVEALHSVIEQTSEGVLWIFLWILKPYLVNEGKNYFSIIMNLLKSYFSNCMWCLSARRDCSQSVLLNKGMYTLLTVQMYVVFGFLHKCYLTKCFQTEYEANFHFALLMQVWMFL